MRVLFAKDAISTGWDCPRAEVLVSFRPAEDETHITQLLGRMVRTPSLGAFPAPTCQNSRRSGRRRCSLGRRGVVALQAACRSACLTTGMRYKGSHRTQRDGFWALQPADSAARPSLTHGSSRTAANRDSSIDSNAMRSVPVRRPPSTSAKPPEGPLKLRCWLLLISGLGVRFPRGAHSS